MRKIITLILAIITTAILIYTKPLNNVNIVKAEITQNEIRFKTDTELQNAIFITNLKQAEYLTSTTTIENALMKSTEQINNEYIYIVYIGFTYQQWSNEQQIQLSLTLTNGNTANNRITARYIIRNYTHNGNEYTFIQMYTPNEDRAQIIYNTTTLNLLYNVNYQIQENFNTNYANSTQNFKSLFESFIEQITPQTPQLTTPTLEIDYNTLKWQPIENAEYYNIYKNNELYTTTTLTEYITIQNGNYQIQACTNNEEYANSELSNTITQNNYNDIIGNGANFYTLFGAVVDSEIHLIKSLTNYTIWGINFYNLFKLFITTCLIFIIIKFALKQKG